MKKIIFGFLAAAIVLPYAASAAVISRDESYYLQADETLAEDLYAAGEGLFILGTAEGDVILGGGNIQIKGTVGGDALLAGGTINIDGTIHDDLRAAGGNITISGNVVGDVFVAGGSIHFLPGSSVEGDVYVAGGNITLGGSVSGSIIAGGGVVIFENGSEVLGDVTYFSDREASIDAGAKIQGAVNFHKKEVRSADRNLGRKLMGLGSLIKLFSYIAFGLVMLWLFRKRAEQLIKGAFLGFGKHLLWGFLVLISVPVGSVLLMVTVLGIPIGIVALLLFGAALILSGVVASLMLGSWIEKLVEKQEAPFTWKTVVVGAFTYSLLGWIPVLGWIAKFVFFLAALGAIARSAYGGHKKKR